MIRVCASISLTNYSARDTQQEQRREGNMNAQRMVSVIVTATFLAGLATVSLAQQSPPPSSTLHQAPATPGKTMTIDCPPAAAAGEPTGQAIGSPQGTGTGSGLTAMPSSGPPQRVAGTIQSIGSTRTNRVIEVSDIKVEVEPSTIILVRCQPGSMADLNQGSKIKAAYEVKEPNRNVATVIEAEH
jgi:hypothetical protein